MMRVEMHKSLKAGVLSAADTLGAFSWVQKSGWRGQRLLILCYHGIAFEDEHIWAPGLYLSVETFRQRMQLLQDRRYNVLALQEGLRRLKDATLPPNSVAITFDDGEYNFHALAYPILRSFGYPSTVYLATYYCFHQIPVFDVTASYLLWKGRGRTLDTRDLLPDGSTVLLSDANFREVYLQFWKSVRERHLSADEKNKLAEELAVRTGYDYAHLTKNRIFHLMTPEETAEISRNNVTVELHTHRHRTPRDRDLFLREIRENREAITSITGIRPKHFCYPSGDYCSDYFPWLRQEGVLSATTCESGIAAAGDEQLRLPRLLDMNSVTQQEFEGWLSGFSALLSGR
jgi:peptidoglycan/xylan/chitin deacetylase (PgdA/CDA1 family)